MIKTGLAEFRANFKDSKNALLASAILTVVVFLILFSASVFGKNITLDIDGEKRTVFLFSNTVEDALHELSADVNKNDDISSDLKDKVYDGQVLKIKKAFPVSFTLNGENRVLYSTSETVADFLNENGISLSEYDSLSVEENAILKDNKEITLSKADVSYETISETIPFETRSVPNHGLSAGKTILKTEGANGLKETNYMIVRRDGEIVEKKVASEKVIKEPVARVTEYGTITAAAVSRSGESIRYKRVLTMTATAYDLSYESTGKRPGQRGYGITASGMVAKRGVVAVDPSVIPLGTRLYIESSDGSYVYGNAIAADKGSAIKGNKIDLFMDTRSECMQFGRRSVKVYILE